MRIGIPIQEMGETVGVRTRYIWFVEDLKHTPVIFNPLETMPKIDGLLLPGGTDVDSKRYQPLLPRWNCYPPDKYLEYFDVNVLPAFISPNFPIFGICRGLQTLNVHFGGSLYRDITHRHVFSTQAKPLAHGIYFLDDSGTGGLVNSRHHQAINKLGKDLRVLAISNDGIIEAIRHEKLPIVAVQWHPEDLFQEAWSRNEARKIFG